MYVAPPVIVEPVSTITPFGSEAIGVMAAAMGFAVPASQTPTSNTVTYVPFQIGPAFTVKKVG